MSSAAVLPSTSHFGGCHCGAVRFQFEASPDFVAWDCNCSICHVKRNVHVIVPRSHFELLEGKDKLTLYQFGTRTAKHYFCSVCGVVSFYVPRSNPDGYAVTVACVKPNTIRSITVNKFDGEHWEEFYGQSGIAAHSKLT
ncbi:hypothetical protein WJX72_009805 [[Myrmecia] bisecta]|uniref:CENP-V/GFA domain-containing protein n=1 Tax=[Myrmecia] bisecta TaxID=41462 RepID=A0AAW1PZ63_9CHLO